MRKQSDRSMESSHTSQFNDLDYQNTIRQTRLIICTVLFLQMLLSGCDLVNVLLRKKYWSILLIPLSLDIINIATTFSQLNAIHYFKVQIFKILITIQIVSAFAQTGLHIYWLFSLNYNDNLIFKIVTFLGISLAGTLLLLSIIKLVYICRNMFHKQQELNLIKSSLMSQEHFQYALKKSMNTN